MSATRCFAKAGFFVFILCASTTLVQARTAALHLITFFIERHHNEKVAEEPVSAIRKITKPGNGDRTFIENNLFKPTVDGIYATYTGWAGISDKNGQIMFPRQHDENRVTLVLTRSLQPVMSEVNLIHHWVAGFDEPVVFYDFQLKEEPETKDLNWHVKKIPTPPSRIIPLHAVVLIASPDQMIIPEGTFPALKGGNLILPTLYAQPHFASGINAIHFLRVNRYFAPVEFAKRYATTQYAEMVLY